MAYAYKVVEIREKLIGGKMSGDKLEKLLNEHGSQGWQRKSITSADIKGRIGPGRCRGAARRVREAKLARTSQQSTQPSRVMLTPIEYRT